MVAFDVGKKTTEEVTKQIKIRKRREGVEGR